MILIGLDLGSRHMGVTIGRGPLPLAILDADTLDVDPHDLDATARIVEALVEERAEDGVPPEVVCEMGALWIPKGASEQQARAMAANHATMAALLDRIHRTLPGPWYHVTTIARRSWSSRVAPGIQGGVTNEQASAALAAHLDPASLWPLLRDQHTRDACGAIVGVLLGPNKRPAPPPLAPGATPRKRLRKPPQGPRKPRPPTARQLAHARHDAALDALLERQQARLAAVPPPAPARIGPCPDRVNAGGRAYRRRVS